MRVISGSAKHLLLKTVPSLDVRPTTDMIKETLFNIIQFDLANKNFLDLFAGSGAIGIEALSRGCSSCTFVDSNVEAIKVIKDNLEHTKLIDKANVCKKDVINFISDYNVNIKNNKNTDLLYDIIFIDPPYKSDLYIPIFRALKENKIYKDDCIIIIETSNNFDENKIIEEGFKIKRVKEYKTNKHIFITI